MAQTAESGAQATEHLAAKAHETVDRVAETAARTEQNVRKSAARAKGRAKESEEWAIEAADETIRKTESYIQQNPIFSAGLALAAGFVLSSLLRR